MNEIIVEENNKKEIQNLGLNALKECFGVNPKDLTEKQLKFIHQKARLGLSFEKEMNLNTRAVEMNYLRVFRLVAEDKVELRKLIKKSIPKYLS